MICVFCLQQARFSSSTHFSCCSVLTLCLCRRCKRVLAVFKPAGQKFLFSEQNLVSPLWSQRPSFFLSCCRPVYSPPASPLRRHVGGWSCDLIGCKSCGRGLTAFFTSADERLLISKSRTRMSLEGCRWLRALRAPLWVVKPSIKLPWQPRDRPPTSIIQGQQTERQNAGREVTEEWRGRGGRRLWFVHLWARPHSLE